MDFIKKYSKLRNSVLNIYIFFLHARHSLWYLFSSEGLLYISQLFSEHKNKEIRHQSYLTLKITGSERNCEPIKLHTGSASLVHSLLIPYWKSLNILIDPTCFLQTLSYQPRLQLFLLAIFIWQSIALTIQNLEFFLNLKSQTIKQQWEKLKAFIFFSLLSTSWTSIKCSRRWQI